MNINKDLNYRLYIQNEKNFVRTSFNHEFDRYRAISSGDVAKVRQNFEEIKKDYTKGKGILSDDPLKNVRYHFIIAAAMTSRMCIENGMNHDVAYTISDIYIRRADKCNSAENIIEMLGEMHIDYATRMKKLRKVTAVSVHIRKCIDYIYDNLQQKLTVRSTAKYLGLDPTYLSKLFVKEVGKGFRQFIIDTKISTAKNMIMNNEISFSEISLALGFSSQSAFISAFKKNTGTTPGEFRKLHHNIYTNNI